MNRLARTASLIALLSPSLLYALNNRSAVSINGLDTNPCTVASPCRSFSQALSQTAVAGEVLALDSGGFGVFVVTQDVIVEGAPGVYAGVTVATGDAIVVYNANSVTLRNLVINGLGTGRYGIFNEGAEVHVENCTVENFMNLAIYSFHNIRISDTTIRNANAGVWLDNNGGGPNSATIINVAVSDSIGGITALRNFDVTVRNSIATNCSTGFSTAAIAPDSSVLNLDSCVASRNNVGVTIGSGGVVRISNCLITGNTTGAEAGSGAMETWGNNKIAGNTTNVTGTLTPIAQQ